MDKVTHQVRCEQWTKIINECLASGMNKTAWCKANGISDKSFFYWQRILRNEAYATTKHLPVPIEAKKETSFGSFSKNTISRLQKTSRMLSKIYKVAPLKK